MNKAYQNRLVPLAFVKSQKAYAVSFFLIENGESSAAGGFPTPDALLGETRQVLQRREPPQRTGSPRPHWLLRRRLVLAQRDRRSSPIAVRRGVSHRVALFPPRCTRTIFQRLVLALRTWFV
ncbi:MAG: hypothetical protein HC862_11600 [Scytonema sp. RU_4_4]|nr:hypothetical protein [Scytonema sp. RU_4_4]